MSSGRNLPCTRTRGALLVVMCRSLPPISIIFFSNSLSVIPGISHLFYRTVSRSTSSMVEEVLRETVQYFFHGGLSQGDLDQAAAPQCDHSLLDGFLFQF